MLVSIVLVSFSCILPFVCGRRPLHENHLYFLLRWKCICHPSLAFIELNFSQWVKVCSNANREVYVCPSVCLSVCLSVSLCAHKKVSVCTGTTFKQSYKCPASASLFTSADIDAHTTPGSGYLRSCLQLPAQLGVLSNGLLRIVITGAALIHMHVDM